MSTSKVSTVSTQDLVEVAHDALATRRLQLLSVEFDIGGGREDEVGHFFAAFFLAKIAVIQAIHAAEHHFRFDLRSQGSCGSTLKA